MGDVWVQPILSVLARSQSPRSVRRQRGVGPPGPRESVGFSSSLRPQLLNQRREEGQIQYRRLVLISLSKNRQAIFLCSLSNSKTRGGELLGTLQVSCWSRSNEASKSIALSLGRKRGGGGVELQISPDLFSHMLPQTLLTP